MSRGISCSDADLTLVVPVLGGTRGGLGRLMAGLLYPPLEGKVGAIPLVKLAFRLCALFESLRVGVSVVVFCCAIMVCFGVAVFALLDRLRAGDVVFVALGFRFGAVP